MPEVGLEPTLAEANTALNRARLPIPPLRRRKERAFYQGVQEAATSGLRLSVAAIECQQMVGARRRAARVGRVSGRRKRSATLLPRLMRPLFWDVESARLRGDRDWPFVARRVLAVGGLRELRWLRRRLGDDTIRALLLESECRGLSPARIRFHELIFDLPKARADAWVETARRQTWARRSRR